VRAAKSSGVALHGAAAPMFHGGQARGWRIVLNPGMALKSSDAMIHRVSLGNQRDDMNRANTARSCWRITVTVQSER